MEKALKYPCMHRIVSYRTAGILTDKDRYNCVKVPSLLKCRKCALVKKREPTANLRVL